ncbi:hypothetical protein [Oceanobacillus indicireducens]|uniref:Uncharacterized protein n=1 Tax=Oceanobacillus indicireducens TaxID=1004261 RepID=A0A918D4D8_9BACI|nr:hypothetical protein [Oceanobacillus indicireducens]GGN64533.1 hypothetical protein GCM10007971_32500 [Oceanobacillus indicireducens]
MPIKSVQFRSRLYPYSQNDCAVVRLLDKNSQHIEIAFPFHEDTPNFILTISEALDLRNAIDELIDIKLIEKQKEEN